MIMQTSAKRKWVKRSQYWDSNSKSIKEYRKQANRKFRRANKKGCNPEIVIKVAGYYW